MLLSGTKEVELMCVDFCTHTQLGALGGEASKDLKLGALFFGLTRLILTFWQVSQDQAFLDSALGQGWAQKGWEYSSFRCLFLCVWVV